MKLGKKDLAWSLLLFLIPVVTLVLGVIPGMAIVHDEAEPSRLLYTSLLAPNGWNNEGITASVLLLSILYLAIMTFAYWRGQSVTVLRIAWIFAMVSTVVGILTIITETRMELMPFAVFPILMAIESVLTYIRLRAEIKRGY